MEIVFSNLFFLQYFQNISILWKKSSFTSAIGTDASQKIICLTFFVLFCCAVLQQTKQIRTVREASGNVPGEVEGSGVTLEKTDASGSFPGNAKDVINRNITLGSGTLKNVAKVENTKGPTGPLNVGPNESKGAGMNLPERAPKVPPQVPLSSAPDKPVKPAVGIISGPSLGKPLGTALAGRPSVQGVSSSQ